MKVQDIQIADKSLWQEFVNDYANGDYYQALAILQNTQLLTKAATANVMNTMTDAVDDVQALYYTNVEDKLSANLATFNTSVDNLADKGIYDQNATYYMGNFVLYDNEVYQYISSTPMSGIPVTNSSFWLKLGLQGDEGVPSVGLNLRYDWQSTAQYNRLDVVTYQDAMYWAKQENMGHIPGGIEGSWGGMAYGNGRYVITNFGEYVSNGNIIYNVCAYSDDGVNWLTAPMPEGIGWHSVIYAGGKFVAVSNFVSLEIGTSWKYVHDSFAYSTDGINWTVVKDTLGSNYPINWGGLACGNGKFVAVGRGLSGGNYGCAAYSDDGINWVANEGRVNHGNRYNDVVYGNGKFVLVGDGVAGYSEDGINWTINEIGDYTPWYKVAYGNGKFVMASFSDSTKIMYAADGVSWNESSSPGVAYCRRLSYGNGVFVGISQPISNIPSKVNSNIIIYSTDGINWQKYELPIDSDFSGPYLCNGKFVVFASDRDLVLYSDDGINWTQSALNIYWSKLFDIVPAKIQVSNKYPADPYTGLIWHQIITEYKWVDVDALNYTFANVDSKNLTWADADNGGW